MAQTRQDMGSGNVKKLLLQLMIPAVVAQVVNLLYNIVDRIYIGHIAGIGAAALTGVGLFAPILMLLNAFAMLIGAGGAPRTAIALGQGNKEEAEKIIGNSFTMLLFFAVVLTIGFYAGAPILLRLFGASEATLPYALAYSRIYILGSVCVLLVMGMNPFITTQGFAKISMLTTVIGAVINIVLDPIFIFTLNMGVTGAAVATIIGQFCGFALAVWFNHRKNTDITLSLRGFRPDFRLIGEIYAIGLPSVIMIAIGSVMTFLMNKILITYHAAHETAATAFGVYFKLNSFIFMPIFGLNNGVIPIVAYNYGAQNRRRMMATIKRSTLYACCIMVFGTVLFWAIPDTLLRLFDASDVMLAAGVPALRIIALSFCMAGMCIALGSSFQALGKSMYSMVTSIVRQLVFLVPIAYVLARYGAAVGNSDLVWWCYPIAEVSSLLLTLVFFRHIYKTVIAPLPEGRE